jgi:hypothetical protein
MHPLVQFLANLFHQNPQPQAQNKNVTPQALANAHAVSQHAQAVAQILQHTSSSPLPGHANFQVLPNTNPQAHSTTFAMPVPHGHPLPFPAQTNQTPYMTLYGGQGAPMHWENDNPDMPAVNIPYTGSNNYINAAPQVLNQKLQNMQRAYRSII